ncbi:hypothetical protein AOU00_12150 [Paenibacillus polymyxa]|nr:hypothetical protein AOU00_12150 [Paenibacillus polymyxa]
MGVRSLLLIKNMTALDLMQCCELGILHQFFLSFVGTATRLDDRGFPCFNFLAVLGILTTKDPSVLCLEGKAMRIFPD